MFVRPMKKKGGILAGLSRPSGERSSPTSGQNGAQVSHILSYLSISVLFRVMRIFLKIPSTSLRCSADSTDVETIL